MRYARVLGLAASAGLVLPSLGWAQTRIDTNGEMVNASPSAGVPSGNLPISWSTYSTGGGGGMAGRWDTGGSSNAFNMKWEDEDAQRALVNGGAKVGTYPGGHSILFGGNMPNNAAGTYGLSQTYTATPGKVYWITGGQGASGDWNGNQSAKYTFDYGVQSGTGVNAGLVSSGNIRVNDTFGRFRNGRFSHAVVATSNQVTAHVGMQAKAGVNTSDINVYADGIRVYEIDAPFNAALVNGGFEGSATDISGYNGKGTDAVANEQNDLLQGWVPLGGAAGQHASYNQASDIVKGGTKSFEFRLAKGNGRLYAAQRLDMGGAGGQYSISGWANARDASSNAMIGIDPTGGLDPNSASIIWSSAAAPLNSWVQLTTGATDTTGNGITIFLAAGTYSTAQGFRTGSANQVGAEDGINGYFGARFDDIQVSYVPEPTTVGLLAIGGVLLSRRRRTA